jgi:hypothetical protein
MVVMLPCAQCKGAMVPITTKEALSFYCDNGHETTLDQLFHGDSEVVTSSLEALVTAWHKNAMALELIVKQAKSKGHEKVVSVFQRHLGGLESRIELLRKVVESHRPSQP